MTTTSCNVYIFITEGILTTPLGFRIPFFEEDTFVAFAVNMGVQSAYGVYGITAVICIEACQAMIINTAKLFVALISANMKEFSGQIETESTMTLALKVRFRNILIQVQDYDR